MKKPLPRWLVWLSRIHQCQGYGIQSPTDFDFVRTVVNEHSPYYAYNEIESANWQERHLGQLYLRLANWRQPDTIISNSFQTWFQAGCRSAHIITKPDDKPLQLAHLQIEQQELFQQLCLHSCQQSVVIIEGIWRDWQAWHAIERSTQTGTTFDLYYCGIVWFDDQRYKHNYRINF